MYLYILISVFICFSLPPSICPSLSHALSLFSPSLSLSFYISICASIYPSVLYTLFFSSSISVSIHLSLSTHCLFRSLSSVSLSFLLYSSSMSFRLSLLLSLSLSLHISVCLCLYSYQPISFPPTFIDLSLSIPISLPPTCYLSISVCISLSLFLFYPSLSLAWPPFSLAASISHHFSILCLIIFSVSLHPGKIFPFSFNFPSDGILADFSKRVDSSVRHRSVTGIFSLLSLYIILMLVDESVLSRPAACAVCEQR